jgi:hypothetical protein
VGGRHTVRYKAVNPPSNLAMKDSLVERVEFVKGAGLSLAIMGTQPRMDLGHLPRHLPQFYYYQVFLYVSHLPATRKGYKTLLGPLVSPSFSNKIFSIIFVPYLGLGRPIP